MAKRSSSRSGRNWFTLLGVVAVAAALVFVGVGVAVSTSRSEPASTTGYVPPEPKKYDYLRVAVLGDSYTVGVGSTSNNGYATQAEQRYCWRLNAQGESSTGYVNTAPDGSPPFTDVGRIAETVSDDPQVIIVQGSTNDAGKPGVREAAESVYRALRAGAPNATIVAVGPTDAPIVPDQALAEIRDQVRAAADASGVQFVDPLELGWLRDETLYGSDRLHPTDSGHKTMAEDLHNVLVERGISTRDYCAAV
ncbi:SGNH/GDSL hydrolase family protein [Rhodococcus sp. Leaf233]|uniref:SGNH/GDSL hydrolase family protein n=1 Tax=Rhodococcus sp. Leaf233 TaxID=1736302 RepID=UPI00138F2ACA|nr:SGNH/GDSL hydrolase family protein [Rhodococcus sp. Leaf233]